MAETRGREPLLLLSLNWGLEIQAASPTNI